MKKVVRMSLLALTAVALLGSCKKKNNEPAPDPGSGTGTNPGGNTGNTPIDASKRIELQLGGNQTSFKLVGLKGSDVIVEGATSSVVATDGNVSEWSYSPSAPEEKSFTTVAGAKVTIKGSIESIAITEGHFKSIDLSNAPQSFTGFYFFEKGEAGTISLEQLNLGDFSGLTNFYLGINPSISSVGPRNLPNRIDLSKMTKLKELGVHITTATTAASLPELTRLILSEASAIGLAKFTTTNYPALERLYGLGARVQEGQSGMNFSNHTKLKDIWMRRTHTPLPINVSNCSTLTRIRTQEALFYGDPKEINLLGTPNLNLGNIVLNGSGTLKKDGLSVPTHSGWNVVTQ